MAYYKYLGPSDTFTVDNKTVSPGDGQTLNVTKEFVEHHMQEAGHRFELHGDEIVPEDKPAPITPTSAASPTPPPVQSNSKDKD